MFKSLSWLDVYISGKYKWDITIIDDEFHHPIKFFCSANNNELYGTLYRAYKEHNFSDRKIGMNLALIAINHRDKRIIDRDKRIIDGIKIITTSQDFAFKSIPNGDVIIQERNNYLNKTLLLV